MSVDNIAESPSRNKKLSPQQLSTIYSFLNLHPHPETRWAPSFQQRFWGKVLVPDSHENCFNWIGARHRKGYGHIVEKQTNYRAHRISFEIFFGAIPEGLCVCHRCDSPPCINPHHLWLGSLKENNQDRNQKDRTAKGSANSQSKLSEKEVIAIRDLYQTGEFTQAHIARIFGVSPQTIGHLINNRYWKHVGSDRNPHSQRPKSKYRGVTYDQSYGRWRAQITVNSQRISLGYFGTDKDAAMAFDTAAIEMGIPERCNFPGTLPESMTRKEVVA